jgi:hypothetical protein
MRVRLPTGWQVTQRTDGLAEEGDNTRDKCHYCKHL